MPLVKRAQTGAVGARRNLNILCDVFLLSTLLMGILLTAPGCCAKIETQIKLLNDDYTVPTRMGYDEASSLSTDSEQQQPTVPHYNLYKDDLKRISYETIHRILRDENEPMIYRTNDLRYFNKRSSTNAVTRHDISKRSLVDARLAGVSLDLSNSNLETFSQVVVNSTHSLDDITSINLHNNSLNEFPLEALSSLTILDLSANNFTHFAVASENSKLRVLNLNQNRVVKFTTRTSSNATHVSGNNLRELHLKDNSMHWLVQLNLSLLNELEILDLSCNQLENLETAFFPSRMKNLKYLNLARNRLQCIYRETFYNLLSMNTLILSNNEITEIDYETFLALPNLQYLDLSHNRLRGDSIRALQGIPDLVGLSIAYNWQLGDSMQEFVASWSLKELDASGTGLCKIPAALAQSVRTLKLADNWLTIINCGDLDSYPLLQYLDLSNSHIDEIEEDALGRLEILETLFLDHNNLKRIPISLPTSLEHLFLHDNQIMDIQSQSFQALNNLKTLDLSANKLLYLPDLPLPKLLTLNLQSSGINGLHQAIVKTSPHLRDLYLEDNPIKCSDLLGIAEWASPCRNDRRIAERINIKSRYIRMHNYFERFHCESSPTTCARCVGDVAPNETPTQGNRAKVQNCAEVNGLGRTAKPAIEGISAPIAKLSSLSQKNYADSIITKSTTDANHNELQRTSNAPKSSPMTGTATAAQPEVSASTTTTIANRILTNSTDKILPLSGQKQLAVESPTQAAPTAPNNRRPLQMKSDNNYVETSAGTSSYPTTPHPSTVGSLLSQENTGKSQKGLKAQSDKATKIGHGINGEISVATTAAKSNLPRTTLERQQGQYIEVQNLGTTTTTAATTTKRMTTTTMSIWQMPKGKGSNEVSKEQQEQQQQQHNKIQEILHTKDRHLIGTPLLMHKGHVVLVPAAELLTPITATAIRTTPTPKENLLPLAPRQNVEASHGNSTTTITTSKGHKLEKLLDEHIQPQPYHYNPSQHYQNQQQQQQGSNENSIIKGGNRKMANSPLGQENHYQDIQQTQQQHKVQSLPASKRIHPTKKQQHSQNQATTNSTNSSAQQKFKEQTPIPSFMRNDKNQKYNNKDEFDDDDDVDDNGRMANKDIASKSTKQFANNFKITPATSKSSMAHSLNTPLDGQITRRETDEIFSKIDEVSRIAATTPAHHTRVNTPLLLKNNDDLHNFDANVVPTSSQSSLNHSNNHESRPITAATSSSSSEKSIPQQQQQQHAIKSERWLDIRKATRHPGLVVVIGVAFTMVFVVGLVQVYRYRQKPLNYVGHQHYGYQPEHQQYQQQDHQRRHHHPYHQYPPHQPQFDNNGNNHNQCNDEQMQPTSSYNSPHHLLRIHEKQPSSSVSLQQPVSCYDKELPPSGYATNRGSSTTTTTNYRLFQLNGKRIKHNYRPSEHEHDFYTEMNHEPQSVLPSDFFPMELLSAPSKVNTTPSSMLDPDPTSSSSPNIIAAAVLPPSHSRSSIGVSLVGQRQHSNPEQRTIIDDDFQDDAAAAGRERSKFDIW